MAENAAPPKSAAWDICTDWPHLVTPLTMKTTNSSTDQSTIVSVAPLSSTGRNHEHHEQRTEGSGNGQRCLISNFKLNSLRRIRHKICDFSAFRTNLPLRTMAIWIGEQSYLCDHRYIIWLLTLQSLTSSAVTRSTRTINKILEITGTEYSDEIQSNSNSDYCHYISFIEHLHFH